MLCKKQPLSEEIWNLQKIMFKVRTCLEELEYYKTIDVNDKDNHDFCLENEMIENSQ